MLGAIDETKPKEYDRIVEVYYTLYILPIIFAAGLALFLFAYKIPRQLTANVIGALLGVALYYYPRLGEIAESSWHLDTVETVYFPLLLLRLLCTIDMHVFLKSLHQVLLISICTTYIPGLTVAYVIMVMKGIPFEPNIIFLIGILFSLNSIPIVLAITNPVKNFEVLLCSEAVFSMVWTLPLMEFLLMSELGMVTHFVQIVALIARSTILAILIGCIVGNIVAALFKCIYFDLFNTIVAMLGASYFTFCLCEFEAGCNGSLATTIVLFFVVREKSKLSTDMSPELLSIVKLLFSTTNNVFSAGLMAIIAANAIGFGSAKDVGPGFAAYILLNIMRAITFFILAAILSRIGYGLNIDSLWAMSLGMVKGPSQLIILLRYRQYGMSMPLLNTLYVQVVIVLLLMGLINGLLGQVVLKAFGILKLSSLHQNNISIAIRNILESRYTMLSTIKTNRFFSDANWPIIYAFTDIRDSNLENDENESDFTFFNSGIRKAQCPSCHKTIAVEPTATEYNDMTREVRLRLLKLKRVSFIRQYEQGIISKNELMGLLQAVETAFDSDEKEIKIDELIENFLTKSFSKKLKKCLLSSQVIKIELHPKTKCRRYCYKTSRSFKFLIPMYLLDITYIVLAIVTIVENYEANPLIDLTFFIFYVVFTIKEVMVILGLSVDSISKGLRRYFRNCWNAIDFSVLMVHYMEITFLLVFITLKFDTGIAMFRFFRLLRVLVLIKLIVLCEKLFPNYLKCLDNMTDSKICHSFTVGRGLIVCHDEIINILPNVCDNSNIRQEIKRNVVSKKIRIMEKLAVIQRERPWISVTVETKQALGATFKGMHDSLNELKLAGYVEKHEYNLLLNVLKERQKVVATYKSVDPPKPKTIFFEVGWLCNDQDSLEYIYNNILMKVWKAGEIICDIGEVITGIYIVVAGVIKMTYKPQEKYLERLRDHGALPIKKILSNTIYDEEQIDYLKIGNTIGELSILTERENSCTYEAYTPCQAFIIPGDILNEAFLRSNDPIHGLRARIWKHLVTDLAKKVLLTTYAYHSLSQLSLNVERGIVPDLKHFKTLVLADLVEDVILIDGVLVDYATRDIYVAPCHVPRSVQRMILSDQNVPGSVPTKLMILPMRDVDEYDVMLKAEMQSEMILRIESSVYEPISQYMQEKSVKRKVDLMMLKKAMGSKMTRSHTLGLPKAQRN